MLTVRQSKHDLLKTKWKQIIATQRKSSRDALEYD